MASCNMCKDGWTFAGEPCPNGCRSESLRAALSSVVPHPSLKDFKWNDPKPPGRVPPKAAGPISTGQLLDLLRMLGAIAAGKKTLTPMKIAHFEWCDSVLAAYADAGLFDAPHVLLARAVEELRRVVEGVKPKPEGPPPVPDYRIALYSIMNRIDDARESGYPKGAAQSELIEEVYKIARQATAYD